MTRSPNPDDDILPRPRHRAAKTTHRGDIAADKMDEEFAAWLPTL